MEGLARNAPLLTYVDEVAGRTPFVLVDVGCSGGIPAGFRRFGSRLQALGLDPVASEIARLNAAETHPRVTYVAGHVGLPDGHPFLASKAGKDHWGRNPWSRLVVGTAGRVRGDAPRPSGTTPPVPSCASDSTRSCNTIVLPDYLASRGIDDVDFVKIDVDGPDLEILHSLDGALDDLGVLGLGVEVNFYGTDAATDHTFHNTDRFLKARGFELFNLTVRRYAMAALPSRYIRPIPGPSVSGRILQGDALYVRDLGSAEHTDTARRLGAKKLLNLVCLFAAFDLPDCAADVIVHHQPALAPFWDTTRALDLLAQQTHGPAHGTVSYFDAVTGFEARDPAFYAVS
jgi:hypothetical protein